MIKEIMLSKTWQLSTEVNPASHSKDPDNRLLTSYPRRRLDAEQLRDAILAVNGNLDLTLFGLRWLLPLAYLIGVLAIMLTQVPR